MTERLFTGHKKNLGWNKMGVFTGQRGAGQKPDPTAKRGAPYLSKYHCPPSAEELLHFRPPGNAQPPSQSKLLPPSPHKLGVHQSSNLGASEEPVVDR